jgi:hypothetical protein
MPAAPASRSHGGWPLALALTGLAAALLLVILLPRLLWPDEAAWGMKLTAVSSARSRRSSAAAHAPGAGGCRVGRSQRAESSTELVGEPAVRPGSTPVLADHDLAGPRAGDGHDPTGEPTAVRSDPTRPRASRARAAAPPTLRTPTTGRPPTIRVSDQIDEGCALVRGGDAKPASRCLLRAHDRKPATRACCCASPTDTSSSKNFRAPPSFYERVLARGSRHRIALLGAAQAYEAMNHRAAARVFLSAVARPGAQERVGAGLFAEEDGLGTAP